MVRTLAAAAVILASILMTVMPVYAEGFIDFYVGAAITRDSDQKVSTPGFSLTTTVEWDTSVTAGGRFGFWFESLEWVGLAPSGGARRADSSFSYRAPPSRIQVRPFAALFSFAISDLARSLPTFFTVTLPDGERLTISSRLAQRSM